MLFTKPPQHGHGWVAWSVAAVLSGGCGWCAVCTGATAAISSRIRAMVSVLVPLASRPQCLNPVESVRQDMHQEPPDELVRLERHGLVAAGSLDPVVLVAERDAGRIGGDEAAVGGGAAGGVTGKICQHPLRPG